MTMEYLDKRLAVSGGVILLLLLLGLLFQYKPYTGIDLGEEYVLAEIAPTKVVPLPPLMED